MTVLLLRGPLAVLRRGWAAALAAIAGFGVLAAQAATVETLCGRIEERGGLRVLRTWGTPAERGRAHGALAAADIAMLIRSEFVARFARRPALLDEARKAVGRLIEYPEDIAAELDALWRAVVDSGVDLQLDEFDRAIDQTDLLIANALDVFGLMGCSSFVVWGGQVEGGGVLLARNFDWPLTGRHLLDRQVLLVQHLPDGRATAAVGWPGFVGAVTGLSRDGLAACLHIGSAAVSLTPEPSSWPTAVAARRILEHGIAGGTPEVLAASRQALSHTSPPAGFLTHVVMPMFTADSPPVLFFETDVRRVVVGRLGADPFVSTNHFMTRDDGRQASKDSLDRRQRLVGGIAGCIATGEGVVSIDAAWRLLAEVQRGGGHAFGTLHSLVCRHEPWFFELRLAEIAERGIVAAPASGRRHVLARDDVFAAVPAAAGDPR